MNLFDEYTVEFHENLNDYKLLNIEQKNVVIFVNNNNKHIIIKDILGKTGETKISTQFNKFKFVDDYIIIECIRNICDVLNGTHYEMHYKTIIYNLKNYDLLYDSHIELLSIDTLTKYETSIGIVYSFELYNQHILFNDHFLLKSKIPTIQSVKDYICVYKIDNIISFYDMINSYVVYQHTINDSFNQIIGWSDQNFVFSKLDNNKLVIGLIDLSPIFNII
jgi:hypothetical protein